MLYYASRRGEAQSGEHESGKLRGLKEKIEKTSKTFEKPLDKQKEKCYNTKVAESKQRAPRLSQRQAKEKV